MEVKVVFVLGPVDSLEIANDVFVDVCGERLRSPELVVDGCVEAKDPGRRGYDLKQVG